MAARRARRAGARAGMPRGHPPSARLKPGMRLGVGIERFDYTKGILDRMRAVDAFVGAHPEWKGRFTFVQVAAPTRSRLPAYQHLQEEARDLAAAINARHGAA